MVNKNTNNTDTIGDSVRSFELVYGVSFFIRSNETVTIGEKYQDFPSEIYRIVYEPKPWWKFWRKKKQIGFYVLWLGR